MPSSGEPVCQTCRKWSFGADYRQVYLVFGNSGRDACHITVFDWQIGAKRCCAWVSGRTENFGRFGSDPAQRVLAAAASYH
jgi:hypothetical protein